MSWVILIASGVLESVWASALGASDNFRRPKPTALFAVSLVLSMAGLAVAMTDIPVGTAYVAFTGIGGLGALALGILLAGDPLTAPRIAGALLVVAGVAALRAAG